MDALRVFIVDDDRDFAESLASLLEGREHQVELAFSGEEAIARFREQDKAVDHLAQTRKEKNNAK